MSEPTSSLFCNISAPTPNNYNPSAGNFQPYLTEEIQNMIKTLKIDHAKKKYQMIIKTMHL
jgi:hypothetical protein